MIMVFYSDATKVLFRHLLGNVGLKGHVEDADIVRVGALMGPYGPLWVLLDRSWKIT